MKIKTAMWEGDKETLSTQTERIIYWMTVVGLGNMAYGIYFQQNFLVIMNSVPVIVGALGIISKNKHKKQKEHKKEVIKTKLEKKEKKNEKKNKI